MKIRRPETLPRRQDGAAAILLLLLIGGAVALAAFASDGVRMTADASQLKRATDAAALAASMARAKDRQADIQGIAERYVASNLGLDDEQVGSELSVQAEAITVNGTAGARVTAAFKASPMLASFTEQTVSVHSAAISRDVSLEIALTLPNTLAEDSANLAALRRLGKSFSANMLNNTDTTWLSVVPYSQAVNVYDAQQSGRLRNWATAGALNPVELTSLFRSGYGSLADPRIPDRRANLLCMYRGVNRGQNYFWDQAPSSAFKVYYRHDLPENGSPGATPISWVGPNPNFGQATGVNDTRWMVADRGCPSAALLPLTNDQGKIDQRLDQMSTRFNVNYAIAMGWSAMSLAPSFRGASGWALPDDLPKDFDEGQGDRVKAIVMLINSTGQRWFDSDSYNAEVGKPTDGCSANTGTSGGACGNGDALITERFANLCSSFRAHRLRFFLIVTGSDEAQDEDGQIRSASDFRRIAGPGLTLCAEKGSDITYLTGRDFVVSEGRIQDRLDEIAEELRQLASLTTLIE
ncbi:Flp pilus assembly protein TadG [Bordetella ansorpii]|uniref:Flp pilus assembly protein TadG n=1 Tax=Bordetella ansorpii TaxID=288768 RepID=A0A157R9N3_9BORD|nr:hypothetical protein [Bordetella ansorpii]SAI54514.1 Flp pilus assembly protein TadG [Bordetella ansorpii]